MAETELTGSRWFAGFWRFLEGPTDAMLRPTKQDLFVDLPERIVEIGAGRGANLSYYPPGTSVLAFEPNEHMHEALLRQAAEHHIEIEIRSDDFRSAGLGANSEDVVVSTLVLCSVGDVRAMVAEVLRVLRPGGRFIFVEHVDKEPGSLGHRVQRVLRRPWRKVGDGCDLLPGTVEAIAAAGFSTLDTKVDQIGPAVDPTCRTYLGVAVK